MSQPPVERLSVIPREVIQEQAEEWKEIERLEWLVHEKYPVLANVLNDWRHRVAPKYDPVLRDFLCWVMEQKSLDNIQTLPSMLDALESAHHSLGRAINCLAKDIKREERWGE